MNYKVLYRKYRPENFDNIVDQDYIVKILKNSIKYDKVSHAYIFSGPRGTGKTTMAKVLAKTLNCLNPTDSGPCDCCEMCKMFASNPDIVELDAASNNGVDEIRELIDNVKILPTYSKYKIYIIDEVHMLTSNAFNALLLTLEEPPHNVIFILATTNIESVPITILSRCQKFDFKKISFPIMIKRLKYVCEQEKIIISEEALEEISYLAEGGMRDALSILDQVYLENEEITLATIQKVYSTVPNKSIENLLLAIQNDDIKLIVSVVEELQSFGINYKTLVKKTIDIIKIKAIEAINEHQNSMFIDYKDLIVRLNETVNVSNIYISSFILYQLAFLECIARKNSNIGLKSIKNEAITKIDNIVEKKEDLKESYFPGNNLDEYKEFKKIRVNNCLVNPQKKLLSEFKEKWENFTGTITDNKMLSLLIDSIPVVASDEIIVLSSSSKGASELINIEADKIEKMISKYYNKPYKVVALLRQEWNEIKQKYIDDVKNHIIYNYMEEVVIKKNNKKDLEAIAKDIFLTEKIEMK